MISNPNFALATLTSISLLTFLDKSSTGAVLIQIHDYFKLTSSQTGLLGTLYPVGQVLAGPFFGYLGDRYSRKWIMIGALVFWNLSSLGVSQINEKQYYFLFMARLFAGIGGAGFFTMVNTWIADLFSPERRKVAFSIFFMVSMIGIGLGFVMGSFVLSLGSWRWAFRIGPLASMPLLGALVMLSEPKRGGADGATKEMVDTESPMSNVRHLLANRSFLWTTLGYTWFASYEQGFGLWAISFLMFAHPSMANSVPAIFGLLVSLFGPIGVYVGMLSSRKLARRSSSSNLLVCASAMLGGALLLFIFLTITTNSPLISLFVCALAIVWLAMLLSPLIETLVEVITPNKRAFADSIQQAFAHLVGSSTGPYLIGLIKSTLEQQMDNKFHAFFLALMFPIVSLVLAGLSFLQATRYYAADKKRADESIQVEISKTNKDQLENPAKVMAY